jgi:Zn-dependent protease with chaperone function
MGFAYFAVALTTVLTPFYTDRKNDRYYGKRDYTDILFDIGMNVVATCASVAVEQIAQLAYSRALETEADKVGQHLMARTPTPTLAGW